MRGEIDENAFKKIEGANRYLCTCNRCGYMWFSSEGVIPVACAKCCNPYWKYLRVLSSSKDLKRPETI